MCCDGPRPTRAVVFVTLGLDLGGQSVHLANLGKGLMERGWTCSIACPDAANGAPFGRQYFEGRGIAVHELPFSRPSNTGAVGRIDAARALGRLARQLRPDVIHAHSVSLTPATWWAARSLRPAPARVATFHNEWISDRRRRASRAAGRIGVAGRLFGHRVIAISAAMNQTIMQELGISSSIVRRVDSAVDDEVFRSPSEAERRKARQTFDVSQYRTVVCCVARLEPRKNQRLLIDVLRVLVDDGLDAA